MNNMIKVWITKYALTQGIIETEAKRCASVNEDMIETKNLGLFHGEGREWHLTKEEAIKRANEMRIKKIASIEKQLDKLKSLKFD